MILGIFLPLGDGNLSRIIEYYLPAYLKKFERIYIFSYTKEKYQLPKECILVLNNYNLNRFAYTLLVPFIYRNYFSEIQIARVFQFSGIIPALLAKLIRKTKVFVTYGYDYRLVEKIMGHRVKSLLYLAFEKILLPFADVIIFSSKTIQKAVAISSAKTAYFPNGINISKFRPLFKKPNKIFTILVQSRLTPEKNLGYFLNAIAKSKISMRLIIIGSGPLKDQLERLARSLDLNLTIKEKIPNDKMPEYYNDADIYVHPSITEGSPKALIEAACCGCCILATDIPQNREILDDCAFYFKINTDDLSKNIKFLYENPKIRDDFKIKVRKKVQYRFDINKLLSRETLLLSGNTPD